jgi:hypothetical protein
MLLPHKLAFNRPVLLVLSSDHFTGATGKTLTITAGKAGGAFAAITPTVTERGSGWYSLALTAAHLDTQGAFALHITAPDSDPRDTLDFCTGAASAWLSMYVGTITGATPTTSTLVDSGLTQTDVDHWAGRHLVFLDGTPAKVATKIEGFTPGTDTLTFVAIPTAPAQGATYVII